MSKLERLLNLTAVLLETTQPLSANQIHERIEGYPEAFDSFRRAFERDKDDLRVLGVPLAIERVPGMDPPLDGYRIRPEEYYLPDPGLEPDELAAIHLASLTVKLDGFGDREALWKLGGISDVDVSRGAEAVANLPTDPALVPIFAAITDKRRLAFTYNGAERSIDPWRIDFHRGRWYLTGLDHTRGEERQFRLDRIEGEVQPEGEAGVAQRPEAPVSGRRLPSWEIGDEAPTMVDLLVDGSHAAWAAQQFGPDVEFVEHADGSITFTVPVVMRHAFRSFVIDFLDHAEIVGPPDMREEFMDWLRTVATGGSR